MSDVQRVLRNAKERWENRDPDTGAKWFSSYYTAIFAGGCENGECEQREGTNVAPAFLSPTEFTEKEMNGADAVCPLCGEGKWVPWPWEIAAISIDNYDIYLEKYQKKLNQINECETLNKERMADSGDSGA